MNRFKHYLKTQWESNVYGAIWIPIIFIAVGTGDVIFILSSLFLGAVALWIIYLLIDKYEKLQLEKRKKTQVFGGPASGIARRGIIFTVGRQVETVAYSLHGLKPEFVGFICTGETIGTAKNADFSKHFTEDTARYEIVNPYEIEDIRTKTKLIIDWMEKKGLSAKDIALDPTGGLTSMSLGAYSAAYERQIDSQYVRSDYDENNKPIPGTQQLTRLTGYLE